MKAQHVNSQHLITRYVCARQPKILRYEQVHLTILTIKLPCSRLPIPPIIFHAKKTKTEKKNKKSSLKKFYDRMIA